MPSFDDTITTPAPPEAVWKLLYDPGRLPEWFAGVERVRRDSEDEYTMWPEGYPDFPMAQRLDSSRVDGRVTISCMVSDLEFEWHLAPLVDTGTRIDVHVEIPEAEAHRLDGQRDAIGESLRNLATLAAREA